jgi:arsenate reductase-like glutaredoxin family protein
LKKADALKLTKEVTDIYAAKGKKVTHVKMKEKPDADTLAKLLLGPTGNLRAPTLRKVKTLIVGFEEETYKKFFGKSS